MQLVLIGMVYCVILVFLASLRRGVYYIYPVHESCQIYEEESE